MPSIGIVIDEGADLPPEIAKKHQIRLVPIKLDWPEIEPLPGNNVYQKMRRLEKKGIKTFGKTSQPSPKDFLDAYRDQLNNFDKIICITLTSKLSGTYNSAVQAKNFLPPSQKENVFVVDSLSVSGGEAMVALKALDFIKNNTQVEEIVESLKNLVSHKINLRVIFKDLKWLEAAGRIHPVVANWARKMGKVGVRPLLGIKKGTIKAMGIRTGAKDIPTALFKEIKEKTKDLQSENKKILVIINHGDALQDSQRLKERIEKEIKGGRVIYMNLVNDIVGSLAGPDSLALTWAEG